eukprot:1155966-Pelagomonas_calceolata.AAC.11
MRSKTQWPEGPSTKAAKGVTKTKNGMDQNEQLQPMEIAMRSEHGAQIRTGSSYKADLVRAPAKNLAGHKGKDGVSL